VGSCFKQLAWFEVFCKIASRKYEKHIHSDCDLLLMRELLNKFHWFSGDSIHNLKDAGEVLYRCTQETTQSLKAKSPKRTSCLKSSDAITTTTKLENFLQNKWTNGLLGQSRSKYRLPCLIKKSASATHSLILFRYNDRSRSGHAAQTVQGLFYTNLPTATPFHVSSLFPQGDQLSVERYDSGCYRQEMPQNDQRHRISVVACV